MNNEITSILHIDIIIHLLLIDFFCLTLFLILVVVMLRDILPEIIDATWSNQYHIVEIINSVPKFILDFLQKLRTKENLDSVESIESNIH